MTDLQNKTRFTTGEIAKVLNVENHRVDYLVDVKGITFIERVGNYRTFSREQAREIAQHDGKNPDAYFPLPPEAPEAPLSPIADASTPPGTPGSLTTGAPQGAARGRVGRQGSEQGQGAKGPSAPGIAALRTPDPSALRPRTTSTPKALSA